VPGLSIVVPPGSPVIDVVGPRTIGVVAAVLPPTLVVAPNALRFGAVACGAEAAARTVAITNHGDAPAEFVVVPASGATSSFTFDPVAGEVPPGAAQDIAFAPLPVPRDPTDAGLGALVSARFTVFVDDQAWPVVVDLVPVGATYELDVTTRAAADGTTAVHAGFATTATAPCATGACPAAERFALDVLTTGTCAPSFTATPEQAAWVRALAPRGTVAAASHPPVAVCGVDGGTTTITVTELPGDGGVCASPRIVVVP
jgi:hypothetical protein